jgi:hypothetical protein
MAVFLAISSREIISKIVSIWFPVMCFVGLGTDHVIANMYFIPLAIFLGSPDISVGYYIWKSMIPSFLGNFIGGGLFTGVVYWYLYLAGEEDVPIHFDADIGAQHTAVFEQGGPVSRTVTGAGGVVEMNGYGHGHGEKHMNGIPDSGNMARSGIASDYHGAQFKREKDTNGEVHGV